LFFYIVLEINLLSFFQFIFTFIFVEPKDFILFFFFFLFFSFFLYPTTQLFFISKQNKIES